MGFEPLTFSAGSPMKRMVPRNAVLLHGRLGGECPDKRAHAQSRMGIGMAAGKARQALARRSIGVGDLAIARHRVIFGIGHDRGALAVGP